MTLKEMIEKNQGWDTPVTMDLADLDFYKFTMCAVYDRKLPDVDVEFKFHCRTNGVNLAKYASSLERELDYLCTLKFSEPVLERLGSLYFFTSGYVDFLRLIQLRRLHITVTPDFSTGELDVRARGPIRLVTWFETHVLAILQELYFRDVHADLDLTYGFNKLQEKVKKYEELSKRYRFALSEFGQRRRAFYAWQNNVIASLVDRFGHNSYHFVGTSNVHMGVMHGIRLSGSQAHEYLQLGQGLPGVRLDQSQKHMLELWQEVYRGHLGIALSDVVGNAAFLRDFDPFFAKLFDGVRHDSGDPVQWAENQIEHYKKLRIDPMTKTLLFSDGLNPEKVEMLLQRFNGRALLAFGVGTDFTNDIGPRALQMVMKVVKVNGKPVAKISDSPGKGMCEDPEFEAYLRKVYNIVEAGNG